jgi:hypothetical protein
MTDIAAACGRDYATPKKEKEIEISRESSDCFYMFVINPKPSDVED